MKKIFFYFFLIFIVASCNEDPEQEINFSISGQIKDAKGLTVYIEAPSERGVIPVAQTLIEENDGSFELEGNLPGLGFYQMRIGENQENSIPLTLAPNDHMKFNTNFGAVSNPAPLSPQKKPVVVCCIPGKEFTP